jgi:hypothetical protein
MEEGEGGSSGGGKEKKKRKTPEKKAYKPKKGTAACAMLLFLHPQRQEGGGQKVQFTTVEIGTCAGREGGREGGVASLIFDPQGWFPTCSFPPSSFPPSLPSSFRKRCPNLHGYSHGEAEEIQQGGPQCQLQRLG